jgi:hypothetical protein
LEQQFDCSSNNNNNSRVSSLLTVYIHLFPGNLSSHHQQRLQDESTDERSPNESLSPLGFLSPAVQQNQQQQAAFLRLFGGHNPFTSTPTTAISNDAMALTAAQLASAAAFAHQQPELQNVLANMPTAATTQASQTAAAALEQLHLQQNLQHSATIMH